MSLFKKQVCHLRLKAEAAAHLLDLMAECFYNADQHICPKVGLLLIDDLLWGSCLYKAFQYLMVSSVWILDQSIQLSVRKSSCTAFSELNIGIRIQDTILPEMIHGLLSSGCLLTTLQNQRTIAGFCQIPGTKKAGRSASDDDRWMYEPGTSRFRKLVFLLFRWHNIFIVNFF